MRSGHAPRGRLAFDADRQLGVGNVLAIAARSLLGSSCVVSRVFAVDERGAYEIGCSGDRMVRAPDASVRDRALVATELVRDHVGVHQRDAERGEAIGDGALAAADASGQSDEQGGARAGGFHGPQR